MANRIMVGISVYNDWEHLDMLLQSIRWYTYQEEEEFDLVVCDDGTRSYGSTVDEATGVLCYTPERVALADKIKDTAQKYGAVYLEHPTNQGIPATWNHLTNALGGESEIVVLLNNDLLMPPNWLEVAVHFLDANKNNPHVGSCYWNPVNRVQKDMMRAMLPLLGHTTFTATDQVSGKELSFNAQSHTEVRIGEGQGLGRVMCPCGCCFAFRRDVWNQVGCFDESLVSFHEESMWGTRCAAAGRASFGFAYPRPYHAHGYTFGISPELRSDERMRNSRRMYRKQWNVPDNIPDHKYFEYVHEKFMSLIPRVRLKYLRPDYTRPSEIRTLPGGEVVKLPQLVEYEEEF